MTSNEFQSNFPGESPENSRNDTYPHTLQKALIRPCEKYEDEYTECKSYKSRRQQIFVNGEIQDCESWAQDLANCKKWTWNGDEDAGHAIIRSEKKRLQDRLRPHMANKVWSKRDKPPEDWNYPLPEFEALNKNSYLATISKNGEDAVSLPKVCVIQ